VPLILFSRAIFITTFEIHVIVMICLKVRW